MNWSSWSAGRTWCSQAHGSREDSPDNQPGNGGRRVYFGTLGDLIDSLEGAHAAGQPKERLKTLTHPELPLRGRERVRLGHGEPREPVLPSDQQPVYTLVDGADLGQGV